MYIVTAMCNLSKQNKGISPQTAFTYHEKKQLLQSWYPELKKSEKVKNNKFQSLWAFEIFRTLDFCVYF